MDRDLFIITVYCLVCEHYQAIVRDCPLRHGGFFPASTDEEVITIEICGEYFKCGTGKDIFNYFQAHYQDWFLLPYRSHAIRTPRGQPEVD
jgi:hypothetical protein